MALVMTSAINSQSLLQCRRAGISGGTRWSSVAVVIPRSLELLLNHSSLWRTRLYFSFSSCGAHRHLWFTSFRIHKTWLVSEVKISVSGASKRCAYVVYQFDQVFRQENPKPTHCGINSKECNVKWITCGIWIRISNTKKKCKLNFKCAANALHCDLLWHEIHARLSWSKLNCRFCFRFSFFFLVEDTLSFDPP